MSLANQSLLNSLALQGTPLQDCETAVGSPGSTTAPVATAILGEAVRVLRSAAGGSLILKSVLAGEGSPLQFVINDSPNSINVFPFQNAAGAQQDFMNGVAGAALAIPAGQSGLLVRVPNNLSGGSSGFRGCVIP